MKTKLRRSRAVLFIIAFAFILFSGISALADTVNYFYDDLNRLYRIEYGNGAVIEYIYDEAGNRTVKRVTDPNAPTSFAAPPGGVYNATQQVVLSCSDAMGSGCNRIYYATNGTTPTTASAFYTSPIPVSAATTLKFFATDQAGNVESVINTQSYTIETTPPTGSIVINANAVFATSPTTSLALSCADVSGCSQMQFSNDNSAWSSPGTYTAAATWTLSPGDGAKTVYAKFKDVAGNWSTVYSDGIILDTALPVTTATPTGGNYTSVQNVTLTCSDGAGSGCNRIYYTIDGSTPTTASSVYTGPSLTLSASTTLKFFAFDLAGNSEAVNTWSYVIDTAPPTGSIVINSGAAFATSPAATLTLTCTDAVSGCSQMQFSNENTTSWSSAYTYAPTRSWSMSSTEGTRTVYAKFKDALGNWSVAYSDTIILDTIAPSALSTAPSSSLTASRVSSGYNHSLAVRPDGTLWAWGGNGYGQLGDGSTAGKLTTFPTGTVSTWDKIAAGQNHTVSLKTDGTLWAWGANTNGQLGIGTTAITSQPTPTQVGTASSWTDIAAGVNHTIALATDRSLWAWGLNSYGQIGNNSNASQNRPVKIGTDSWNRIAGGYQHTAAVRADGTLWAWGYNAQGQLGIGTTAITSQLTPTQVGTVNTWTAVAAGYQHTVAVKADGTLWAWGSNSSGALGVGSGAVVSATTPTQVGTANTWIAVASGYQHTAALRSDGTLWAWGNNTFGQVGNNSTAPQYSPVQIGSGYSAVAAGQFHTVALKTDGTVWAWGNNVTGQVGDATITQKRVPVPVKAYKSAVINSDAIATNSTAVTLTTYVSDTNGVVQMQFSNDNTTWSAPEAYTATKALTLSTGDGVKTVYARYMDMAGNWSAAYSDTIILDTLAPRVTIITPSAGIISTSTPTLTYVTGNKAGVTKIGVVQNVAQDFVQSLDRNGNGVWDGALVDGSSSFAVKSVPISGDWNGDGTTKAGYFRAGTWYLDTNGNGVWDGIPIDAKFSFLMGLPDAIPVTGDWNGDGKTEIGIYDPAVGAWYLDYNGNGAWDGAPADVLYGNFGAGMIGEIPVTGNWNGDGKTEIGIYDPSNALWYLDFDGSGVWEGTPTDKTFVFLAGKEVIVTGDWSGDGVTKIGVFVDGMWYLDLNGNGIWDGMPTDGLYSFGLGWPDPMPVVGDWTGNGRDDIGVFVPSTGLWTVDLNGNGTWDGPAPDGAYTFGAGLPNPIPVVGDWNGTGTKKIGVFSTGLWYLDMNGNGIWDSTPTDRMFWFGTGWTNPTPVVGDWTGTGTTKIGAFYNGLWMLDLNGDGLWDGPTMDGFYQFGSAGEVPITGDWIGAGPVTEVVKVDSVVVMQRSNQRLDPLNDGNRTIRVEATDAAGNTTFMEVTITVDTRPVGSIVINSGAVATSSQSVTLTTVCTDDIGCSQMQFSNDNTTWSAPEVYTATKAWTISPGDGTKTVYAKFKDETGNWSSVYSATIVLDTQAPRTRRFSIICAGGYHNAAINIFRKLWTWGNYDPVLKQIDTATNWTLVSAGFGHTAALKTDGTLWAWGWNGNGQLGDGTNVYKSTPVRIGTATNWALVSAGFYYTVALKTDGTLWAWGWNIYGQLGDGTTVDKSTPVQIGTATNWALVSAGYDHTAALKTDGTLWAWGNNDRGQLGDGGFGSRTAPFGPLAAGAVSINNGAAVTNNTTVTLTFDVTDNNGIAQMQFSNDNVTWSSPVNYAATAPWTLQSGDGAKTVYATFKDIAGNWSPAYFATIVLDTQATSGP